MTTETKKKGLIIGLVMFGLFALVVFMAHLTNKLTRPNANDNRLGTVSVYFPATVPTQVTTNTLAELSRLGPTFTQAANSYTADVVVTTSYQDNCTSAGYHRLATNVATIFTNCTHSPEMMQLALMHEIGHVLGMTHVCRNAITNETTCSPVGYGPAFMNPVIEDGYTEDLVPNRGLQYELTSLDIAEYRRIKTTN